jgi:hypothetical protein
LLNNLKVKKEYAILNWVIWAFIKSDNLNEKKAYFLLLK